MLGLKKENFFTHFSIRVNSIHFIIIRIIIINFSFHSFRRQQHEEFIFRMRKFFKLKKLFKYCENL